MFLDLRVHWKKCTALLIMSGWMFLHTASLHAEDARPSVIVKLVSDKLYVGETPRVTIKLTAPENQGVSVVKNDSLIIRKRQALWMDLLQEDGKRVPGGPPCYEPHKSPDDFVFLPAGKSISIKSSVANYADKPGNYAVQVKFTPTPDENFKVTKELPLTYQEIPNDVIADKVVRKGPVGINDPEDRKEVFELMNVKTEKGHELLYRLSSYEDNKLIDVKLDRLLPLDADSKITAITKFPGRGDVSEQIWLTYNKGGDLYFARIEYVTGVVLENIRLASKDDPMSKKGQE